MQFIKHRFNPAVFPTGQVAEMVLIRATGRTDAQYNFTSQRLLKAGLLEDAPKASTATNTDNSRFNYYFLLTSLPAQFCSVTLNRAQFQSVWLSLARRVRAVAI